jgi:PTS system mannose-specific IID component
MRRQLLEAFARSLIVQASWNYERMVGVGVAYVMEPLLRDLGGAGVSVRSSRALKRVASFFNAHPYLTGMAAGALARAEHEGLPEAQAERLKNALIGPLGSLGDQLIWAGWLPLSAAAGLIVAATVSVPAGVAAFLLAYNAVHLGLRAWGLAVGWRTGIGVAGALAGRLLQLGVRFAALAAPFAIGLALPVVLARLAEGFQARERLAAAVVGALGLLIARGLAPTVSGVKLGLLFVLSALAAGWIWR